MYDKLRRGDPKDPEKINQIVAEMRRFVLKVGPGLESAQLPTGGTSIALAYPWFFAKITGNAQDGTNKRYKYAWSEVVNTVTGYGTANWTAPTGGRTGTTSARYGMNLTENMNGATGMLGNGVTVANLVGTFALIPAPSNLIVQMFMVPVGATTQYWFSYQNGIDGACP